jgi:AcrR family transcriptional regulator
MAKKAQPTSRQGDGAVDALMALAAERGWYATSLADIARRAKISLVELHEQYDSKRAILREFLEGLDVAVLKGDLPDPEASVRDRLFEVMMRRFDAMQTYREGIRSILRDTAGDPVSWIRGGPRVLASACLMLEAAGQSSSGPAGRAKAQAVACIYVSTLRRWLDDDSPDLSKTMAALDKSLRRAESVALFLCRGRGGRKAGGAESAEPVKA